MKKLMVQSLREFGSGHENTERIVREEMVSLVEAFRKQKGVAFDPARIVLTSVVNALTASVRCFIRIMFGMTSKDIFTE